MRAPDTFRSKAAVLHALTFLVAFCSFAYELVFAELLTVVYGGTVVQYGLTVGLFFSSLGLGSFLSRDLDDDRPANFFRTEVYLALVAPAGFVAVLALNAYRLPQGVPPVAVELLSRAPVVLVGLLSGFELPLLTAMVERTTDDPATVEADPVAALRERVRSASARLLSAFFHVSPGSGDLDDYSTVLGMDYLGGLAGSIVYVFVLYPRLGLIPTVFVLGLVNALAAVVFVVRFSGVRGPFAGESRTLTSRETRTLVAVGLLLTAAYGVAVVQHETVDDSLSAFYLEHRIEAEYAPGAVDASVTGQWTTQYQQVVRYDRTWTGAGDPPRWADAHDECLRLGTAVQLCDSWAEPYHRGLVDVPMALYDNGSDTEVLLVGGGDYVAVDHLRRYDVSVDQVDIDREFLQHARTSDYLRQYNDGAWRYDRLNTTVADAYAYLGRTDERYDLILLDLPGAKDDDLLHLYSTEFYDRLRTHLDPDGVVATWAYTRASHAAHNDAYVNTVRAAGFDRYAPYWAYDDLDGDGQTEYVERFYLLAPGDRPAVDAANGTAYTRRYADRYRDLQWRATPHYRGVAVNSVFHPNYDVLVD